MSKIRLLIVTDEMEVGGTQRQISHILRNINTDVFTPELLYFRNDSFLVDELSDSGITVYKITKSHKIDIKFVYNLYKHIKKGNYDIVHCFALSAEIWGFVCSLLIHDFKLITSIRGQYEWYSSFQWFIKRVITMHSCLVISNSTITASYTYNRISLDKDNLKVIYNGLDTTPKINNPPKDIFNLVSEYKVVSMFVGRLVEHKNIPELLHAFNIIQEKKLANICLVVVGGGDREDEYISLAKHYKLDNVFFIGERSDIDDLLQLADFVISSSFREGLSNTILESMLAGVPVIATRVGGTPEIITHDKNGILYESGNIDELVTNIIDLAENMTHRQKLGENARKKIIECFSVSAMVSEYEKTYLSLK